ncbi:SitI3 family protein [Saccharothrix deserti]|uniref:SitI3 family protein n=1 Tax=Saccharothrix deserti TaxID=2593674 RepID=UPI00131AA70D|nr:SitI3 family protein [Saccharothrix deserti]
MSISYSLALATPRPVEQVAEALREVGVATGLLDPATTGDRLLGENAATTGGTWLRVVADKPKPWNPVIDVLNATPTVRAAFRLDKTADISRQQDDVIRLVTGVLAKVPGDAVLHHDFEVIWLMRRGGELLLNERDDIWPPHRLAVLAQPYRRETHAFPED